MPAWFEPVRIGGRRFVDGCAWSDTNLDLLAGEDLDEVFVLAPTCARVMDHPRSIPARMERRLRRISSARLTREARLVRDAGTQVRLLVPGPQDLAAMGANLMDPQHRLSVLDVSLRTTTAALARDEPGAAAPSTPDSRGPVDPENSPAAPPPPTEGPTVPQEGAR
jgi:NTE family protein